MSKQIRRMVFLCLSIFIGFGQVIYASPNTLNENTEVSGKVVDADGEPLVGVNIRVKDRIIGTSTDADGNFSLTVSQDPPVSLIFSIVGFQNVEVEVTSNSDFLDVVMEEQTIYGTDVVVSASRVEESVIDAPVTIEKMDILTVRSDAADDYYSSISKLKGIDMTASSINFQIVNARGFNSTGNTRMVQLTDGMDTQAPALNFPIGNLNGPGELDIESVEFIPGASSALYGPNAFSGILLVTSKDPFQYQGLSVKLKNGYNHLDGDETVGEPGDIQPMYNFAMRYATAFNNKFAFKVNLDYMSAEDWRGTDFRDKNAAFQGNLATNPAYDAIHRYGDDGSFNIGLLAVDPGTVAALAAGITASTGGLIPESITSQYVTAMPSQPVNRTGYDEHYLVDYGAENIKANASAHYRITDNAELSYTFNYGFGTSIYTGAQRYSLVDFSVAQHKLQLEGDNFEIKAYGTFENSGDSYIADFVGFSINEQYTSSTDWFGTYGATFAGGLLQAAMTAQGGDPTYNAATVNAILSDPNTVSALHAAARTAADANRFEPGTPEFEAAFNNAIGATVPNGALFDDDSRFYHVEGQYNFKNEIEAVDLIAGASFRQFQLRSNGTIFDDAGGVEINEFGGFVQATKSLMEDKLKLSGSIRYDKNENFDGQISPRISAVFGVADNQNIRASFQTGFRNPTTQGQYIDLNVITARLLGGLPRFADKYGITENTYTIESVEAFTNALLAGDAAAAALLVPFTTYDPVKPEQIQAYEVGYKGLINNRLFVDFAYYYNIYNDFITQVRVRQAAGAFTGDPATDQLIAASLLSGDASNTFQIYTNNDETLTAHGAVFGLEYSIGSGYKAGFNYNYNKLIDGLGDEFLNDFNTPEHKINVSFSNRKLTDNIGFNVTYRWQDAFRWESSFARLDLDAVSTIDAQVTYNLPQYNALVKLGGSNITNQTYTLSGGGPNMSGIYYVSIVFDGLLR